MRFSSTFSGPLTSRTRLWVSAIAIASTCCLRSDAAQPATEPASGQSLVRQVTEEIALRAAQESRIAVLAANFRYEPHGLGVRSVQVAYDVRGDRVAATVVHEKSTGPDRSLVHLWNWNTLTEIEAIPEQLTDLPGTWRVEIARPGTFAIDRATRRRELGLDLLDTALVKMTSVLHDLMADPPAPATATTDIHIDSAGVLTTARKTYDHGRLTYLARFKFDASADPHRLVEFEEWEPVSTTDLAPASGDPPFSYRLKLSNFLTIDKVPIPQTIEQFGLDKARHCTT